jgi:hypothetical protein
MTTGRMLPTTCLGLDVEVLVDGAWRPGVLEYWRQRDGRREGWVRWSTGPGETRIGWYDRSPCGQATQG